VSTVVRPQATRPRRRVPAILRQDWYFAVALAAFVGVAVWFGRSIKDFIAPSSPAIAVPSLVGQTIADAVRQAGAGGLKAVVVSRRNSDRFPKDIVMLQQPPAGSKVREGRQISVVVSNGVTILPMPDLREETLREVGLDLSHDKLLLGRTRVVPNDQVPANRVVSQDPPPLTSVCVGTVVSVDLSKGPPPAVRVPSFVNMSIDEARRFAGEANVRLGQVVWTPFGRGGPPRGIVVRQNPSATQLVDSNARVSLQVSAGPDVTGYLLRQVHVAIVVPSQKAGEVRIVLKDETGSYPLYDAFAEPRQRLDFTVTALGTAQLDLYVDNEELSSTSLGVEPKNVQHNQYPAPRPAAPNAGTAGESNGVTVLSTPLPNALATLGPLRGR